MENTPPTFLRHLVGFVGGALISALASAAVFVSFVPFPVEHRPTDHTREAFLVLVLAMLFCGGFIGARAFSADAFTDVLPRVGIVYGAIAGLCLLASLDLRESAIMIAFASAGILCSSVALLLLGRRFPRRDENAA